jgi:hypothetical protein
MVMAYYVFNTDVQVYQLLDDLNERSGYCKLQEEAPACTEWRSGLGGGCGLVVRQTTKWTKYNTKLTLEGETPRHVKHHNVSNK